jgi:uroporphyrinogen-III synthase
MRMQPTPLQGKRILVTRAREQAQEFVGQLELLGAEILIFPTVTFAEVEDAEPLNRAVIELDKFDWVIFTSANAVKFLANRFKALRIPTERINHLMLAPQIAVIGSATGDEAWSIGFIPQYEAVKSNGEALALELLDKLRGKRVLLPRSDLASSILPTALREAGADVVEVVAYRNIAPQAYDARVLEDVREGRVDVITLFSPSAYQHLIEEIDLDDLRRQSGKILLATIGPVTSAAVRQDGLEVAVESSSASAAALCEAIATYFRQPGH